MSLEPKPLVVVSGRGLYCPAGDFYIDPSQPVQTAVITHAHGDHLRHGSARYILARPGVGIAERRLGRDHTGIVALEYGTPIAIGPVKVSLHPAGHILGSAQVRIEHEGWVWVVSGDYKRQLDPTCAPFELLRADVFISEATFALPMYRWPPTAQVIEEIVRWWRHNRDRGVASVLFCYALGKAQRVLAELQAFADEPVYVHQAVHSVVELYEQAGVRMAPCVPVTNGPGRDYRGTLVIAPPNAAGTAWMRRFGEHSTGFCSGWMQNRGGRRRRGYDRGFVISDHADWPALVKTCTGTGARRVLLTHGYTVALARHLQELGIEASALEASHEMAE